MTTPWIEIDEIAITWAHEPARVEINRPWPQRPVQTYGLQVTGQVVGRFTPPKILRIRLADGYTARYTAVCRFDGEGVATLHLAAAVGIADLPARFVATVEIVLDDGTSHPVCVVRGRRTERLAPADCRLSPLLLVTLGRSGSTWLMRELHKHPALVCYPNYPYEVRLGQQQALAATVMARPTEIDTEQHYDRARQQPLGRMLSFTPSTKVFEPLAEAARCQVNAMLGATEALYQAVAASEGKPHAQFFVEKYTIERGFIDRAEKLYGLCKIVILVRDFRDLLASILAFNAKRGSLEFGRQNVNSDYDYVSYFAMQADALANLRTELGDRAVLVRYEQLMEDPRATLGTLFAALGLAQIWLETPVTEQPDAAERMSFHRTTDSAADSIGRWQRDLDPGLAALANERLGGALRAFGYPDPGS